MAFKFNSFVVGVATIALAVMVLVLAVSSVRGAQSGSDAAAGADALPVATEPVVLLDQASVETRFPALISARRESALGFEAGGQIAVVNVDVGAHVSQGDGLARLDTRSIEAQLAAIQARARSAQARAELADATLERQRQLVEQGHVSPQRLDEARADAAAARADLASADAEAAALQVRLDLSQITAPFDGVITARLADEGAIANPGTPVFQLVEDGELELRAGLPSAEVARLEVGQTYRAQVGEEVIAVTFRAATGVVDARRRAVSALFDVEPSRSVQAGEVARLILVTQLDAQGFWAPMTALTEGRRGLWSIYVLVPEGDASILEPRPVEIIHTENDRVYLTGSVRDGERFLSSGVHRVVPGQSVRPASEG